MIWMGSHLDLGFLLGVRTFLISPNIAVLKALEIRYLSLGICRIYSFTGISVRYLTFF